MINYLRHLLVATTIITLLHSNALALDLLDDIDDSVVAENDIEELGELRVLENNIDEKLQIIDKAKGSPDSLRIIADRLIDISLGVDILLSAELLTNSPKDQNLAKEKEKVNYTNSLRFSNDASFDDVLVTSKFDARIITADGSDSDESENLEEDLKLALSKLPDLRTFEEKKESEYISKLSELEIIKYAITYYEKILIDYPRYSKNDYVVYQLARSYNDIGDADQSVTYLSLLIKIYPTSNYVAEAFFRRAEYYSTRGDLESADRDYLAVLNYGPYSNFYEYALYKRGWAKFRQGQYEDALNSFTELLDVRLLAKYDYDELALLSEEESADANIQKLQDTLRAISISFSYLDGVNDINRYFKRIGRRKYENLIYEALANYYVEKQRYSEAADVYFRFIKIYPYHSLAPKFYLKISEIYEVAGFINLEINLRKEFARSFDLRSEYWTYFDLSKRQDIVDIVTKNLLDLASYYHFRVQESQKRGQDFSDDFKEAEEWYTRYLASFPNSKQASTTAYFLGELYNANKNYEQASLFYEDAAYVYPKGEHSSDAAYSTVVMRSLFVDIAETQEDKNRASENFLASSLRFSYAYPNHPESKNIQLRTAKILFESKKFLSAVKEAKFLLTNFPKLSNDDRFAAWRIIAYSLYDGNDPKTSETALLQALKYAPNKTRADRKEINNLKDNLAASVFRQAEQFRDMKKYDEALAQFIRVGQIAPKSKNRINADYDISSIHMLKEDWKKAISTLNGFRKKYRKHKLQFDVTKKLAIAYKENLQFEKSAREFERIEKESKDVEFRKAALIQAANLYKSLGSSRRVIRTYNRYVAKFPKPIEGKLGVLQLLADEYTKLNNKKQRRRLVVRIFNEAKKVKGESRTTKVVYYMASAQMELNYPKFEKYSKIKLTIPLKRSLARKKKAFKSVLKIYGDLAKIKIANIKSGATYYLGTAYLEFSKSFLESQRPRKLKGLDLIQYEEIIEEQAEPFENTGIKILRKNLELLDIGLYDKWVQKSIEKLGEIFPGRFAKKERYETIVDDIL